MKIGNQDKEAIFSLNSLNSILCLQFSFEKICCHRFPWPSEIFGFVLKLDVVQDWRF